jgi:hypothetical protein
MVAFHDTGNRAGRTWGSVIEHRDAGYHVILPGNLEWGASIPNPPGRTVMVTNALGIVCWDVKTRGSNGCSGPSGNGTPADAGFLAADAPAGALIMKSHLVTIKAAAKLWSARVPRCDMVAVRAPQWEISLFSEQNESTR